MLGCSNITRNNNNKNAASHTQLGQAYLTVVEVDGAESSANGGAVGIVVGAQRPYAGDAAWVDGGHVGCGTQ